MAGKIIKSKPVVPVGYTRNKIRLLARPRISAPEKSSSNVGFVRTKADIMFGSPHIRVSGPKGLSSAGQLPVLLRVFNVEGLLLASTTYLRRVMDMDISMSSLQQDAGGFVSSNVGNSLGPCNRNEFLCLFYARTGNNVLFAVNYTYIWWLDETQPAPLWAYQLLAGHRVAFQAIRPSP